jgi:hypothetical protein
MLDAELPFVETKEFQAEYHLACHIASQDLSGISLIVAVITTGSGTCELAIMSQAFGRIT